MTIIKNIKLNKFNDKLLGAAVFINAEFIAPFVKNSKETHISIEIEQCKEGILIRPVEALVLA